MLWNVLTLQSQYWTSTLRTNIKSVKLSRMPCGPCVICKLYLSPPGREKLKGYSARKELIKSSDICRCDSYGMRKHNLSPALPRFFLQPFELVISCQLYHLQFAGVEKQLVFLRISRSNRDERGKVFNYVCFERGVFRFLSSVDPRCFGWLVANVRCASSVLWRSVHRWFMINVYNV